MPKILPSSQSREIDFTDPAEWNQEPQRRLAPEQFRRADSNDPVLLCCHGKRSPLPPIYGAGIMLFQLASYFTALPGFRVPDIGDRHVIVLAPEKRRFAVSAADAEHRTRGRLSLTLRRHPVLHAHRVA
jgi:hypothetical protein